MTSSASATLHKALGLPPALSTALRATRYAPTPYAFASCTLPHPALRLDRPPHHVDIALPLLPCQAEHLAATSLAPPRSTDQHASTRVACTDCSRLHFPASRLSFANPAWPRALEQLIATVCDHLAVPFHAITYHLSGLVLAKPGDDHVDIQPDIETTHPPFATCQIQLPSHFEGGAFIFHHQANHETFLAGASDTSNTFTYYYTAILNGVPYDALPLTHGYRLTLVYNLVWTAQAPQPSPDPRHLAAVKAALQHYVASRPANDWYLAFMLDQDYAQTSLSRQGIRALKGPDRRTVAVLSAAAQALGIGKLDFLLCPIEKHHDIVFQEAGSFLPRHSIICTLTGCKAFYCEDGSAFKEEIGGVDWSFLSYRYSHMRHSRLNGLPTVRVGITYQTMATIVWATDNRLEALYKAQSYQISSYLEDENQGPCGARADRILCCLRNIETRALRRRVWKRTETLLEFCFKHGLHEQMSRAIVFAATVPCEESGYVAQILFQYISGHGWDAIRDAVLEYLCYDQVALGRHAGEPLVVLYQLLPWMSTTEGVACFAETASAIENHCTTCEGKHVRTRACGMKALGRERYWARVFSVMADLGQRCQGVNGEADRTVLDGIGTRIASVVGVMCQKDARAAFESLSRAVVLTRSHQLEKLTSLLERRVSTVTRERIEMRNVKSDCDGGIEDDMKRDRTCLAQQYRHAQKDGNSRQTPSMPGRTGSQESARLSSQSMKELVDSFVYTYREHTDALLSVVCDTSNDPNEEQILAALEQRVRQAVEEMDPPNDGGED